MLNPRRMERRKPLIFSIVGIIALTAVIFFGYKVLTENKLTRFDIELSNINCAAPAEIEAFLKSKNMNYFYYKSDLVESDLRQKFYCIGKIEQEIYYPNRLKLKLTGREGKYVIKTINTDIETNPQIVLTLEQLNATESTAQAFPPQVLKQILDTYKQASGSGLFIIDEEGVVFENALSDAILPRIVLFGKDPRIGQKIADDLIVKVEEILAKLAPIDLDSTNLIVVGDRLIIDTKPRVTFSLSKEIPRQAASLQLILRQAKMNLDPEKTDSRSVESIDLRFDRPVVIYSK